MNRNTWRARLTTLALFVTFAAGQHFIMADVDNTPIGMFMYHGSAAAVDLFLLVLAAHILSGDLSFDMQILCVASMLTNFIGWVAYLLYFSPIYYDSMIWALNAIQIIKLFSGGIYGADRDGLFMVRRGDSGWNQFHLRKKN